MKKEKVKIMLYALAGLAFVTATVFTFGLNIGRRDTVNTEVSDTETMVEDQSQTEEVTETAPNQTKTNTPASIGGELTYEEALKKYEGRRIQFDPTCKATPSQLTAKTGTEVMFDNRSAVTQTISFDDQSFNILPYNYTIINLFTSAPTLPYNVIMDCGNSKNVAQVYLQK